MIWTWLDFVSSVVASLAWPIAIVLIALILKKPIVNLLRTLRFLRYGDVEFEFDQELKKIEGKIEENQPLPPVQTIEESKAKDLFEELVAASPKAAVLATWQEVEYTMNELANQLNIDTKSWRSPVNLVNVLKSNEQITSNAVELLLELRKLRNRLAHTGPSVEIAESEARRYREIANSVIMQLRSQMTERRLVQ